MIYLQDFKDARYHEHKKNWNNICRTECIRQYINGEVDNGVGGGECDYVKFTERT